MGWERKTKNDKLHISWDFHVQLTALETRYPLTSITWRIAGSSVVLTEVTCLWIFIGSQAQVFLQIIRKSHKIKAPLLGLAKSIYWPLFLVSQNSGHTLTACKNLFRSEGHKESYNVVKCFLSTFWTILVQNKLSLLHRVWQNRKDIAGIVQVKLKKSLMHKFT